MYHDEEEPEYGSLLYMQRKLGLKETLDMKDCKGLEDYNTMILTQILQTNLHILDTLKSIDDKTQRKYPDGNMGPG